MYDDLVLEINNTLQTIWTVLGFFLSLCLRLKLFQVQ